MSKKSAAESQKKRVRKKADVSVAIWFGLIALALSAGLAPIFFQERRHAEESKEHQENFHKPQHGGIIGMVGHRKYELVTNAMHVSVYLYDDTKPAIAEGGSVRLDYTLGARTQSLMLKPAGQNKFDAARPPELAGVRSVSVQISLPGSKLHFVEFDISQSGG